MPVNKKSTLSVLVRMASIVHRSRVGRFLPTSMWRFVVGSRLLGDIKFGFNAEICGTRFQLQGPFRHTGGDYYASYLTQGAYEPAVTTHITQTVRECPAPRVLDVGAHYGWYTIYLAKTIGNKGAVFAFEPSEAVFSILKQNVELNELRNVYLYKLPLSNKQEPVRMVVSQHTPRESRYMYAIEEEKDYCANVLYAIPFDELDKTEAIRPNIVKIDVHGVWRKVIDGMKESLYRDVKHLYLELDSLFGGLSSQYADIQHVILILRDAGMDIYEIENFRRREGGRMIKTNELQLAEKHEAMLYGVKRRRQV
jgi:FkbM family methyltransferase